MAKKRITSKPGLFGVTYHYENGKCIGKSRPGLWGNRTIHFNEKGKQIASSRPGYFSDEVHYDKNSNRYVSSYPGLITKNHISNGCPAGKSVPGLFGTTYSSINSDEETADYAEEEILDYQADFIEEDGFDIEDDNTVRSIDAQSNWKRILKKVVGIFFVIETIFFVVLAIIASANGDNIIALISATLISAGIAGWCLYPTIKGACISNKAVEEKSNEPIIRSESKMQTALNPKMFAEFCERNFDLDSIIGYHYESLSVCILDCIFSLRARYEATTIPVVQRYAEVYMRNDRLAGGDTVSMLINNIDAAGGAELFADNVLKNRQKTGGVLKSKVCYDLARKLKSLHIESVEDFRNFEQQDLLEVVVRSVKGIGDAGANYLFMLAGDPNRCKPDVHIHRCIKDACGDDVSNDDCQTLFTQTVDILRKKHPNLTVRLLDNIIWNRYSQKKEE